MTRFQFGIVREDRTQDAAGIFDADHPSAIWYVRHGLDHRPLGVLKTARFQATLGVDFANGSNVLTGSTKVIGGSVTLVMPL
jgi:hypothetical protein